MAHEMVSRYFLSLFLTGSGMQGQGCYGAQDLLQKAVAGSKVFGNSATKILTLSKPPKHQAV